MSDAVAFARSLYAPDAIRAAVAAYAELASFQITESDEDVIVRITEPDSDVAHCLADELANYALVETIARRPKAAREPR